MIIIDYSQICIAAIFADQGFQSAANTPSVESKLLLKHMILNSIRSYSKNYGAEYGKLVICADGKNTWRKQAFPYYKASRKKSRDSSPLNWEFVFEVLHETLDDLRLNFPYPILKFDGMEGDDCVAAATRYSIENNTAMVGLFEDVEPILIVSSDKDFIQLQEKGPVRQYSPMQKKFVEVENPKHTLIEKIVTGDAGDGVPNILSDDDTFVTEGKRQKPFRRDRLPEFFEKGIDACKTDSERRNYQRNELLISFDKIPEELYNQAIEELSSELQKKPNRMKMMNYFIKNGMKHLLEVVDQF